MSTVRAVFIVLATVIFGGSITPAQNANQGSSGTESNQPSQRHRSLISHGFEFDNRSAPMVSISAPDGRRCKIQAFVEMESSDDPYAYTSGKLDRATYVGDCVNGFLEGVSIVIADGTKKQAREAYIAYFLNGRIAYPALKSYIDDVELNFGVKERTFSQGCVYYERWNRTNTKVSCKKLKNIYGDDIFSEFNARALRNGSFDLTKYRRNFGRFMDWP